jgi:hypothetical protein
MARAATTTDVFNAVAEPRRREILDLLAGGERSVNDLVALLDLAQPHDGRFRWYRLNGPALKPIHEWITAYVHTWNDRFEALDSVLDELKQQEDPHGDRRK